MATILDSTTSRPIPALVRSIDSDPDTRDYLMRLNGEPIGYARTPQLAKTTLDALCAEIRAHEQVALLDALDDLDRVSPDTPVFRDARTHLLAGVRVWLSTSRMIYEVDQWIVVPHRARVGWPWRCLCEEGRFGTTRCWHAALCEALELVREQQADDSDTALAV